MQRWIHQVTKIFHMSSLSFSCSILILQARKICGKELFMRWHNRLLLTIRIMSVSVETPRTAPVFRAGHEHAWKGTLWSDLATELSGQITPLKVSTSSKDIPKMRSAKCFSWGWGGKFGDFCEICGRVRNGNEFTWLNFCFLNCTLALTLKCPCQPAVVLEAM